MGITKNGTRTTQGEDTAQDGTMVVHHCSSRVMIISKGGIEGKNGRYVFACYITLFLAAFSHIDKQHSQ
jgi:hypothetical protein